MTDPKPTAYFWYKANSKVLEYFGSTRLHEIPQYLCGMCCVDVTQREKRLRYGKYTINQTDWLPLTIEDFPKEFRVHLLLLGVV